MRIGVAADHGGFTMKEQLAADLRKAGFEVSDFGARELDRDDDYPDFMIPLARAVAAGNLERGIALCSSGVGASIVANKVAGVRAALVHDSYSAHQGVEDDDMNVICLGSQVVGYAEAWELVRVFLAAAFSGAGRHRRRLAKVAALDCGEDGFADMPAAEELIAQLDLVKHPEGGWYRETYRSGETIQGAALPARFAGDRSVGTAIFFFLQSGDISALHRIKSDEIWHFYAGAPLTVHVITPQGAYQPLKLGPNMVSGEAFQRVVPAGCWFGAELSGDGYSLVGCTVSPGFDFADFEMGDRAELLQQFPAHTEIIRRLTSAPHKDCHQEAP